jgi:hypothetical protein
MAPRKAPPRQPHGRNIRGHQNPGVREATAKIRQEVKGMSASEKDALLRSLGFSSNQVGRAIMHGARNVQAESKKKK